jgi:serine/threonine-protein kinase
VAERALEGEQARLKEHVIAEQVFDRGEAFDPGTDTIVRVEARRLRAKLKEYYEKEGQNDPVIIEIPDRGYTALFRTRPHPTTVPWFRSPKLVLAAAVLLFGGIAAWRLTLRSGADKPGSIVVLPFTNLSGDPANEYFSDGLTEEIIGTLASLPQLRVVARTSAFRFKGRGEDVRKIGRDLGVETVLEGGVRKEGQRIRVSAQLVNVSDGMHLWSKIYDREGTQLLRVQEEITRAIVDALAIRLAPGEKDLLRPPQAASSQAYELYLKGRYFWYRMTPLDLKKSIACLEQSVALDPKYAAAYAGLADAYSLWANFELEPPWEFLLKAKRAAQNALELDNRSAEGHFSMGVVRTQADWDWDGAEREFQRALELKPTLVAARQAYAVLCLGPLRRHDEAAKQLSRALESDPLSLSLRSLLGQTFVYAGQPHRAMEELREALDLEPSFFYSNITMALAYLARSSYPEALRVLEGIRDTAGEIPYYAGLLGYTHARLGNRKEAERILQQFRARFQGPWVPPVEVAGIHNGLGDKEQALHWLERACQQRSTMSAFAVVDPRFRNLHPDPRFQSVLRRMGLVH